MATGLVQRVEDVIGMELLAAQWTLVGHPLVLSTILTPSFVALIRTAILNLLERAKAWTFTFRNPETRVPT